MNSQQRLSARDLLLPPNLLSLSRVALTPLIGLALSRGDDRSTVIAVLLMLTAAVTDALDGYLARRLGQTSALGLILDPLADKLFVAVTVVLLCLYRELPLWLASVIIGRDIIILAAAAVFPSRLAGFPSTITGKYAFLYIVLLIGCYTVRFDFGIRLFTGPVVGLIAAVLVVYGRRLWRLLHGRPEPVFQDRTSYRLLRVGLTAVLVVACIGKFLLDAMR